MEEQVGSFYLPDFVGTSKMSRTFRIKTMELRYLTFRFNYSFAFPSILDGLAGFPHLNPKHFEAHANPQDISFVLSSSVALRYPYVTGNPIFSQLDSFGSHLTY